MVVCSSSTDPHPPTDPGARRAPCITTSLLEVAEQVSQLLGAEFLVERLGHRGDVRVLDLLDLSGRDLGALALGVAQDDPLRRLLDDQAAEDASVAGRDDGRLEFLAYGPAGVHEADEQEV